MDDTGVLLTLCLGGPLLLFLAGFGVGRASKRVPEPPPRWSVAPPPPTGRGAVWPSDDGADRLRWLLAELERPPLRDAVDPAVMAELRAHYADRLAYIVAPPAAVAKRSLAAAEPEPAAAGARGTAPAPAAVAASAATAPASPSPTAPSPLPWASATRPSRPMPRPWESWDSAVILLYLGAFLVVAAGLVYASYNWAALGGWQKVGLLAAATVAFAGGGLALLPVRRVRPAAETFVGVGAFLVPMNAIAAANVFAAARARPALTLELGALLVALLYALFAFRPGGLAYRYGTAVAALLAVGALPPALGSDWGWGAVLLTLVTAAVPDAPRLLAGRWRRFARPASVAGLVALPLGTLAGVATTLAGQGSTWVAPAALAAAALAVGRLALRRGSESLAGVWTGIVGAAIVAALAAGERPLADGVVVAVAVAAVWLLLGEVGPALLRRPRTRALLHGEAVGLLVWAPALAALDGRWILFTLAWVGAAAGTAALARLRRAPAFLVLAGLCATAAYLSLGRWLPGRLVEGAALPLLLAPAALGLAGAALGLGRRRGGVRGRRWALPLWLVAAVDAVGVTVVALALVLDAEFAEPRSLLALAAVGAAFAAAAVAGAGTLRRPEGLVAAAVWALAAAWAPLWALPIAADRRSPLLVAAAAGLAGALWAAPRLGRRDVAVGRDGALGVLGLGGGLALAAMLLVTAGYVFDPNRPAMMTAHPETGWWWPYLGFYAAAAVMAGWVGSRLRRPALAPLATIPVVAALLLGLRMAYAVAPLDRWSWLPLLALVGAAVVGVGLGLRVRGLGVGKDDPFARRLGLEVAGAGAVVGLAGLGGAVILTLAYVADLAAPYAVPRGGDAAWWWRFLALHAAVALAAGAIGRRTDRGEAAPVVVGFGALTALLALRMATTDLVLWTYAGFAAAALAYGARLVGREAGGAFGRALRAVLPWAGAAVAAVALPANLLLGARGEADDWVQAVVYALLAGGVFAAGLRERRPEATYGAAATLAVAIAFGGAASGLAAIDGAAAYAVLSWLLASGALTLPAAGRWAGQRLAWERAAYGAGALPILLGLTAPGALDPGSAVYARLTLAVLSLAGVVAMVAAVRRSAARGYAASLLGMAALLMRIGAERPDDVQAFTAPTAAYLIALGWTRRRDERVYDALTGAGAALLLVPPFLRSFAPDGFRWALIGGAGALGFVFLGLLVRRRTPLAAGVVALTVVTLRQTVDAVNALPTWAILGLVGLALLAIGTATLAAREALLAWLARGRARWSGLR